MKTEMVSYCLYYVCEKLWWTYILQRGGDSMSELYHYGVKGMKWGVRRTKDQLSRKTSHTAKKRKTDNKVKNKVKVKDILKSSHINQGLDFIQRQIIQQQMDQQFINWSMQESTRASINAANQAASLGMTGGTNPFMFGMM